MALFWPISQQGIGQSRKAICHLKAQSIFYKVALKIFYLISNTSSF